jgi:hypothetical protein
MSQKIVGFCCCGCGFLLAIISIIALAVSWGNTAKKLISWTVANEKEFTLECKDGARLVDTILLYREEDGKCEGQFKSTRVTFSPQTAENAEQVALISNCTGPALAVDASTADSAVEFMARRLDVVGDLQRGGYEPMATFTFLNETDSNNAAQCVLGTYTVKSDKPLWAISVADKLKDTVVGFFKIVLSLAAFTALCCLGIVCAAVGGCLLACLT